MIRGWVSIRTRVLVVSIKEVRKVLKGKVKRWLNGRGYGFIEPEEGGEDVFVHRSEVHGTYELRESQRVKFEVQSTSRGPEAINVRLIG